MEELQEKIVLLLMDNDVNESGHENYIDTTKKILSLISKTESRAQVPCSGVLSALLDVVKDIRKSDCGGWLKDCDGLFNCRDGREKRRELMRLLDKLYKVKPQPYFSCGSLFQRAAKKSGPTSSMLLNIIPVSKPRMTRRDKWLKPARPSVAKYWSYKAELQLNKVSLPECHHVTFVLPMPKSWSLKKKKSLCGKPHTQTPDADNLIKGLWDAIYKQDCGIWDFRATKLWGAEGMIKVEALE